MANNARALPTRPPTEALPYKTEELSYYDLADRAGEASKEAFYSDQNFYNRDMADVWMNAAKEHNTKLQAGAQPKGFQWPQIDYDRLSEKVPHYSWSDTNWARAAGEADPYKNKGMPKAVQSRQSLGMVRPGVHMFRPDKLTPMHEQHHALGVDLGKRGHYTDPRKSNLPGMPPDPSRSDYAGWGHNVHEIQATTGSNNADQLFGTIPQEAYRAYKRIDQPRGPNRRARTSAVDKWNASIPGNYGDLMKAGADKAAGGTDWKGWRPDDGLIDYLYDTFKKTDNFKRAPLDDLPPETEGHIKDMIKLGHNNKKPAGMFTGKAMFS
jgi:hypothetical protein